MINHFIHPIRFYTPRHFFEEKCRAKTNGMDKMMEYHSGLVHKLMEKLTENCVQFLGIYPTLYDEIRNKNKCVSP